MTGCQYSRRQVCPALAVVTVREEWWDAERPMCFAHAQVMVAAAVPSGTGGEQVITISPLPRVAAPTGSGQSDADDDRRP